MNIVDVKARARRLKTFAKSKRNLELTHAQALEATAFMDIGKDWNTYSSQLAEPAKPVEPEITLSRGEIVFVTLSEILNTYAIPEAVDGLLAYCNKMTLADYMVAKNKPRPPFESFHTQCWELASFMEGLRLLNPDGALSFTSSLSYAHPEGRLLTAQLNQRAVKAAQHCGMQGLYQLLRDKVGPGMPERASLVDTQLIVVKTASRSLAKTANMSTVNSGTFIMVGHADHNPATMFLDEPALLESTLVLGNGLSLNVQKLFQSLLSLHRKSTVWIDLGHNRRNSNLDQPMDTYTTLNDFITTATSTPQTRPAYIQASATPARVIDELLQWFERRMLAPKAVRFVVVTNSAKIEPATLLRLLKSARKAKIALILQEQYVDAWAGTTSSNLAEDWVPVAIDLIGNYALIDEQKHAYSITASSKTDENNLSARLYKAMGFDLNMLAAGAAANQYWLVSNKQCHLLRV